MGAKGAAPREYGSYVRQAYKDGIALEQSRGFNPYKFGLVSGSDSHVSAVPYRQNNFFGVHGTVDDTPEKRVVWAAKDPDSANLDRIQVVKGWSKNGQSFEKVAWAGTRKRDPATGKVPPIGSTVDLARATYKNTIGAVELKTVWTDPDFDPGLDAFYYVRVLEIPTPRWSTIQAVKLGRVPPSGPGFFPIIQERAWSSPIWYTPSAETRKAGKPGVTVADLKQQGAVALSDAQAFCGGEADQARCVA